MNFTKGMLFMKNQLMNNIRVVHSTVLEEFEQQIDFTYPFTKELLCLLKRENKFEQEYYYLERDEDYAFFVLYKNRMNIFTFGKMKWYYPLKVIGYPCSFSNCGYITNNEMLLLEYVSTMKGAKLILNVPEHMDAGDFTEGETLPTCIWENRFQDVSAYLDSLRSSYRRRIRKAIERSGDIERKEITDDSIDIYDLYLNTYEKSNYKLEKLEPGFFREVDATKIVFLKSEQPIGFVLLKKVEEQLIFMLCGMDYQYDTADLYYYMLYSIIEYAIKHGCRRVDLGQTSEETKMKFGAVLEKRYFYAHHSNNLLNRLIGLGKSMLEYQYHFPDYHVYKVVKGK